MVGVKDTLIVFPSEFSDKDFLFFIEKERGYPIKYAFENKWSCYFLYNRFNQSSKKRNRIELEILLPFDKFETANDSQCVEILKQSILDAIENYKNKNIPQQYIDVIVEKMKASINE